MNDDQDSKRKPEPGTPRDLTSLPPIPVFDLESLPQSRRLTPEEIEQRQRDGRVAEMRE